MRQETFTDMEYSCRKKRTKREEFLAIMEDIIPWEEWVGIIAPYYPQGKRGRPPMGIEKMLRMYLLQIWFHLSDPATEDAIYDSYAMRKFTGINFLTESVPDKTTLCKFRHLLEEHGLNKLFFEAINRVMAETGHMLQGGTIIDATIINAPSSTKNAEKARDPEIHQTKKGNEWRFGMKCHIGVDAHSGLVHTIAVTAANAHDITQAANLIREEDEVVYGDSACLGIEKRSEVTSDTHLSSIDYRINRRPGSLARVSDKAIDWERHIEYLKSSVRCKAKWNMSFGLSNVSLDTEKPSTADSGRMRIVYTRCLPAPIYMRLPGLEGISLLPGKGETAPFYRFRGSLSVKIAPADSYLLGRFWPARSTSLEFGDLFRVSLRYVKHHITQEKPPPHRHIHNVSAACQGTARSVWHFKKSCFSCDNRGPNSQSANKRLASGQNKKNFMLEGEITKCHPPIKDLCLYSAF